MLLYDKVFDKLYEGSSGGQGSSNSSTDIDKFHEETRTAKVEHCYQTVRCLRHYRQVYGFKATTPLQIRQAALAAFILLKDLSAFGKFPTTCATASRRPSITSTESRAADATESSHDGALSECFRCLLASAVQITMFRGVLRMLVQTARELRLTLPENVQEMLRLLGDMVWQPKDIRQYSSLYPNYVFTDNFDEAEDLRIEALLRKWEKFDIRGDSMAG